MRDVQDILEDAALAAQSVGLPTDRYDRLLRRRDHERRAKRLSAGVIVLLVCAALAVSADRVMFDDTVPASLPDTPQEWSVARVPQTNEIYTEWNGMDAITAGGPGLVAVGNSNGRRHRDGLLLNGPASVWTSPDGESWTHIVGDGLGDGRMLDVTPGGPGLVAVGSYEATTDAAHNGQLGGFQDAVVWTSPDGATWTRSPSNPALFGSATMNAVAAGPAGIVAVGWHLSVAHPAVWFSTDGQSWTRVLPVGLGQWLDVAATDHGFVAVDGSSIWMSPDGTTWTRVYEASSSGMTVNSIAAGPNGNGMVAIGTTRDPETYVGHPGVLTSPDGINWSRVDPKDPAFNSTPEPGQSTMLGAASVSATRDGFVIVGSLAECPNHPSWAACVEHAIAWTSSDGFSWGRVASAPVFGQTNDGMVSVTSWGTRFVAVGPAGTIWVTHR